MSKHTIQIDDNELYSKLLEYCKLNNLKLNKFVSELLRKQFYIEIYGDIPFGCIIKNEPKENMKKEDIDIVEKTLSINNKIIDDISSTTKTVDDTKENTSNDLLLNNNIKPKKRRL